MDALEPPFTSRARLIFALLVRTVLSESLAQANEARSLLAISELRRELGRV